MESRVMQRARSVDGSTPPRSVRVSDGVWNDAKARAAKDGTTISNAINVFLEYYGVGMIALPTVPLSHRD